MLKKRKWVVPAVLLVLALTVFFFRGKRPFQDLKPADLRGASVRLSPPDQTVEIWETKELVEKLRDVVIYQRDDTFWMYAGQGVTFTLEMADGSQLEVTAFNPFIILNGKGYRCEYGPCEALNAYANRLLNE